MNIINQSILPYPQRFFRAQRTPILIKQGARAYAHANTLRWRARPTPTPRAANARRRNRPEPDTTGRTPKQGARAYAHANTLRWRARPAPAPGAADAIPGHPDTIPADTEIKLPELLTTQLHENKAARALVNTVA